MSDNGVSNELEVDRPTLRTPQYEFRWQRGHRLVAETCDIPSLQNFSESKPGGLATDALQLRLMTRLCRHPLPKCHSSFWRRIGPQGEFCEA